MNDRPLMKDGVDVIAVERIAKALTRVYAGFEFERFTEECIKGLEPLELRQRIDHIIQVLHHFLPADFSQTATILCALPSVWDKGSSDDPLRGFAMWPLIDYVAVYGLEHPGQSLDVCEALTGLFSAEFAVRPFIEKHEDITSQYFAKWSMSKDENLRRLASEGLRPRLPWGQNLKAFIDDPALVIEIIENLRLDKSLYVRRSVANNVNDISKDHPDLVIALLSKWLELDPDDKGLQWLVRHAARTLVKSGHPQIFTLLGYTQSPQIEIIEFSLSANSVCLGQSLSFTASLLSNANGQKVVIDYAVYFVKANGSNRPKVFKLRNLVLDSGEHICLTKPLSFKAISTRKYYPGRHYITLLVNGVEHQRLEFDVVASI